jgi:hypothetical protein
MTAMRRALLRVVPASLAIVAIASYGAFLFEAHAAARNVNVRPQYLQLFGSASNEYRNSFINWPAGAIKIGRFSTNSASAEWRLGPVDKPLAPGTTIPSEEIFITGVDLALYRHNSYATISLDGRQIGTLRPAITKPEDRVAFPEGNVPLQPIDVPPGFEMGFRFIVPANSACVVRACALGIHVANATWVVRRVGLLFETEPPPAAALWSPRGAGWKIVLVAAGLAVFSHLLLSLRIRRSGASRTIEWNIASSVR